jgi:hypothetical protein
VGYSVFLIKKEKKMNREEKLEEEIKFRGFGCKTITTR